MQAIPQAKSPEGFVDPHVGEPLSRLVEIGPADRGTGREVVLALGPAFGSALATTIGGLEHEDVLEAILGGVAAEGMIARIVRVYHSSDCAAIGYVGARLSGSGIGIGLQSRGTTVIHQKNLAPLNNLELFPQSPSLTLQTYQAIGRNAARYAMGIPTVPVAVEIDNGARLRLIVKTALLHRRETDEVCPERPPQELRFDWEPDL
ncbi:MAG: glycerol dehydratase [Chloroflexi bacterium]|nr:glycerol dehydratase [Chloroflexota bacterium]